METFKEKIEQSVRSKKNIASSELAGNLGFILGTSVGLFSLPFGLLILVSGAVYDAIETNKNMNDPMSDEWLKMVSDYQEASPEGLAFLARALSKKGYVSISDAADWVDIEKQEQEKNDVKKAIANCSHLPGATSLLHRAKKECGILLNFDVVSKAFSLIEKVVVPKTVASAAVQFCKLFLGK